MEKQSRSEIGSTARTMLVVALAVAMAAFTVMGVSVATAPAASAYCGNFNNGLTLTQSWGIEMANENCTSPSSYSGKIRDNGANNDVCAYAVFVPRFEPLVGDGFNWQGAGCNNWYSGYTYNGVYNGGTGSYDQNADMFVCNGWTSGGVPTFASCGFPKRHYPG